MGFEKSTNKDAPVPNDPAGILIKSGLLNVIMFIPFWTFHVNDNILSLQTKSVVATCWLFTYKEFMPRQLSTFIL